MDQLNHEITLILAEKQIKSLTPIQNKTLSYALQKKNIIAVSRTGTGKTLAYVLPIVQRALKHKKKHFALVIVPTKDLAVQITNVFTMFNPVGLKTHLAINDRQLNDPHIIVGTPGSIRKIVHKIAHVYILVMDEVDKLFHDNFNDDIKLIISGLVATHDRNQLPKKTANENNMQSGKKRIRKNYETEKTMKQKKL